MRQTYVSLKSKHMFLGFTLSEVLVAISVMALMVVALMSYVHFAGMVWVRTHQAVSLTSEANVVLDAIERELLQAKSVLVPNIGEERDYIEYYKEVSDYGAGNKTDYGFAKFRIRYDSANRRIILQVISVPSGSDPYHPSAADWASETSDGDRTINANVYNYDLARHVTMFAAARVGPKAIRMKLKFEGSIEAREITRAIIVERLVLMPEL